MNTTTIDNQATSGYEAITAVWQKITGFFALEQPYKPVAIRTRDAGVDIDPLELPLEDKLRFGMYHQLK